MCTGGYLYTRALRGPKYVYWWVTIYQGIEGTYVYWWVTIYQGIEGT